MRSWIPYMLCAEVIYFKISTTLDGQVNKVPNSGSIASYVENILTSQLVHLQIADRVATAALATREIYAKYA